jgi:hypothetical protein
MLENYRVAYQLGISRVVLNCMELVIYILWVNCFLCKSVPGLENREYGRKDPSR